MRFLFFALLVVLVWHQTQAAVSNRPFVNHRTAQNNNYVYPNQSVEYFRGQKLDHFDHQNPSVFSQRYFVVSEFWKPPYGPIILNICGEYTCPGIMPERLWIVDIAKQYGALILTLEHRFWGQSLPFSDLSTSHLKYLTTQQALADLAYFTSFYQTALNNVYNKTDNNVWFSIGGSYPGALAAWYRLKYPHLTAFSLSSSGVVNAILNFTQFDEQAETSAGPLCSGYIRQALDEVQQRMPSIQAEFQATVLTDQGDFWLMLGDVVAEAMQYGHRLVICDALSAAYQQSTSLADALANFTVNFFYRVMGGSPMDYYTDYLAQPNYPAYAGGRQWWYMTCAELGWFQTYRGVNSLRSSVLTLDYFQKKCSLMFQQPLWPDVDAVNNFYGGNKPAGSRIYFTNGVEDPWQWAGVRASLSPDMPASISDCPLCAHCVELYTPSELDPAPLTKVRSTVLDVMGDWLQTASPIQVHHHFNISVPIKI